MASCVPRDDETGRPVDPIHIAPGDAQSGEADRGAVACRVYGHTFAVDPCYRSIPASDLRRDDPR